MLHLPLKNENNLKNEDDLINDDDLKNEDDLKNKDNLKYQPSSKGGTRYPACNTHNLKIQNSHRGLKNC